MSYLLFKKNKHKQFYGFKQYDKTAQQHMIIGGHMIINKSNIKNIINNT